MDKLDDYQRLVLWNQYEILKHLNPNETRDYDEKQQILQYGFEIALPWIHEHTVYEGVSRETCQEVMDILTAFRALDNAVVAVTVPATTPDIKFWGFDGNDEGDHLAFARFLIETQGKFTESTMPSLNSHSNTLGKYRRMVDAWKALGGSHNLTAAEVTTITTA